MLSKKDIEREIGKGINLFPLFSENIKENSINLTVSQYAWTMGKDTNVLFANGRFSVRIETDTKKGFHLRHGQKCYYKPKGKEEGYIILLPRSATIIETEEVIGIGKRIGGAVHSKVGIVAKGIGDTGTMLGPGFCGHLMISLHNITDEIIALRVGTTFASLTFDYLNTAIDSRTSTTTSGHVDKFAELGIKCDEETLNELAADWKSNVPGIRQKMLQSDAFKSFDEQRRQSRMNVRTLFRLAKENKSKILAVAITFIMMVAIPIIADLFIGGHQCIKWFANIACSGIGIMILSGIWKISGRDD